MQVPELEHVEPVVRVGIAAGLATGHKLLHQLFLKQLLLLHLLHFLKKLLSGGHVVQSTGSRPRILRPVFFGICRLVAFRIRMRRCLRLARGLLLAGSHLFKYL